MMMHSRIKTSGCPQNGVLMRGIGAGILILLVGLLFSGVADATTENIINGSYVTDVLPNANFGVEASYVVYKDDGFGIGEYWGYIELPINLNILHLIFYVSDGAVLESNLSFYNTSVFDESTITWNTKPVSGDYLTSYIVPAGFSGWVNVTLNNSAKYIVIKPSTIGMYSVITSDNDISGNLPYIKYPTSYDPSGYVKDSLGNPLTGVNVTLSNATASASNTSDVLGFWNLSGQLSDGLYNYSAQKSGYTTTTGNQTFTNGGNTLVNITLTIIPEVTISCPAAGWCYVGSNYSSKTLLELDNLFSTDTIQGHYNSTSQKYESHRTGYSFNQNVSVVQKEGYYYYFSSAQNVTMTPGSTPSITLKTGWNLVSNYGSSARTLSALKTSIGASATQAKYYDKTLKTWVSTDSQSVPAMESFFVYVTSQTEWSD